MRDEGEEGGRTRVSRLAVASVAVIGLWYAAVVAYAAYMVSRPASDPQGWDALPLVILIFYGWTPAAVLSACLGVAALARIGPARPGLTGRGLAWAGIAMSVLAPAFWWLVAWALREVA